MTAQPHLVILGGGIKGAALAALAAISGRYLVTLVERDKVASGATSANHGRLHAGTAGYLTEDTALIRHRYLSSQPTRRIPGAVTFETAGLYCFSDQQESAQFADKVGQAGIPCARADAASITPAWLDPAYRAAAIAVPEYGFNPARLAGRLARTAQNAGAQILTGRAVHAVEREGDQYAVHLGGAPPLVCNVVVNAAARWASMIPVPAGAPRVDVRWFAWSLLVLDLRQGTAIAHPKRVIMVMDPQEEGQSVIPHPNWLTLDCKSTAVHPVAEPEFHDQYWRPFDSRHVGDASNLGHLQRVFPTLRTIDPVQGDARLYSLTGVHGRRTDASVGSRNHVQHTGAVPGYYVAFGGQASTGVSDAIETFFTVTAGHYPESGDQERLLETFFGSVAHQPLPGFAAMRWERQPERPSELSQASRETA